jgi:hypothetical protein
MLSSRIRSLWRDGAKHTKIMKHLPLSSIHESLESLVWLVPSSSQYPTMALNFSCNLWLWGHSSSGLPFSWLLHQHTCFPISFWLFTSKIDQGPCSLFRYHTYWMNLESFHNGHQHHRRRSSDIRPVIAWLAYWISWSPSVLSSTLCRPLCLVLSLLHGCMFGLPLRIFGHHETYEDSNRFLSHLHSLDLMNYSEVLSIFEPLRWRTDIKKSSMQK